LTDIGANLTHASFQPDLGEVVQRAREHGVGTLIVTGTSVEESRRATEIADAHGLYATVGVHPHHARDCDEETVPSLREIARHPRVVAIGECGLDFNRNYSPHPDQEKWFVAQVELGISLDKPLFLHSRDAHPRFSQIISSLKPRKAVAHCFTGEREELHAYLDLGLYVGITGWICDERRGQALRESAALVPRERVMIETDAPYLLPRTLVPKPPHRRNEPAFLPAVLAETARCRNEDPAALAAATTANACRLFGLTLARSGIGSDGASELV
jgi:TatD DNase family protein